MRRVAGMNWILWEYFVSFWLTFEGEVFRPRKPRVGLQFEHGDRLVATSWLLGLGVLCEDRTGIPAVLKPVPREAKD